MVHVDGPSGLDGVAVEFDDDRAVCDAGIVLAASLASWLGVEALVDETVDLGERVGAANPGEKVMTLVSSMTLGADCIEDCDVLRAGRTGLVLGHRVVAPSTLGTFPACVHLGHVRQLDRVLGQLIQRAWATDAGPGVERLVHGGVRLWVRLRVQLWVRLWVLSFFAPPRCFGCSGVVFRCGGVCEKSMSPQLAVVSDRLAPLGTSLVRWLVLVVAVRSRGRC
jgi:hypothetical protein